MCKPGFTCFQMCGCIARHCRRWFGRRREQFSTFCIAERGDFTPQAGVWPSRAELACLFSYGVVLYSMWRLFSRLLNIIPVGLNNCWPLSYLRSSSCSKKINIDMACYNTTYTHTYIHVRTSFFPLYESMSGFQVLNCTSEQGTPVQGCILS